MSALNIEVIDYMLEHYSALAKEVVAYIVSHEANEDVQVFLESFFNTPKVNHIALATLLAQHPWPQIFEHLVSDNLIADEPERLAVFNAALMNVQSAESYEFGEKTVDYLEHNHAHLEVITTDQTESLSSRVFEAIKQIGIVIPDLSVLGKTLKSRIIADHRYEISIPNLRVALDIDGYPSLDEIRKKTPVWEYCKLNIGNYLEAVDKDDSPSDGLVISEHVFIELLNEQVEVWSEEHIDTVIQHAATTAHISNISDVPEPLWTSVVEHSSIKNTARNINEYVAAFGVDEALAAFLKKSTIEEITEIEDDSRAKLTVQILNAKDYLTVDERVTLAKSVVPEGRFDLSAVSVHAEQLLAYGLEEDLFADDFETFSHFSAGGWEAMAEAFRVSANIETFMAPTLIQGYVSRFLKNRGPSKALKRTVVENLSQYVPSDDVEALREAAEFALKESVKLPLNEVERIARIAQPIQAVMRQLVLSSKEIETNQIIEILALLGAPYDALVKESGNVFDYPNSFSSLDTVFKRLERERRIEIAKRKNGRGRTVKVL